MPTLPMTMVHLLCTSGTTSRVIWLKQQCSSALALAVPPVRAAHSPFSRRGVIDADDPHLMSAYEAFANTPPSPHGGADMGLVVELEMPQALALIRTHGRLLLDAAHRTGSFLYRGESPIVGGFPHGGEGVGGPRAVKETPDLLDDQTYDSSAASEYFRAVDSMMDREFHAQARPATAHIMVSNKEAAAEWGTACSIWPLGESLDYSWLKDCAEWWNPGWEKRSDGRVSLVNEERRQPLFWRDDQRLKRFLSGNLRVNRGLPEALRRGHEVLVRSGEFTVSLVRGGGGGTRISVRDAFVCIPAFADSEVRSALGVVLDGK